MSKAFAIPVATITALLWLCACRPGAIGRYSNLYLDHDTTIELCANPQNQLHIMYTGCGGMVIQSDSFSILLDPFYSYTGPSILWKKLSTNVKMVDTVCRRINACCGGTSNIQAVLVAHSHYDHLSDLPYLLHHQLQGQQLTIVGSSSTQNALRGSMVAGSHFMLPSFASGSRETSLALNNEIQATIIRSGHAPHARLLGHNLQWMQGSIGAKGLRGFDTLHYRTRFSRWKEGDDYSFLLEIRPRNRPKPFRIFIQSSSCTPPAGIPAHLPAGDSVDLAFIGVASTNYTLHYPDSLLAVIKPRQVVLIHWEDFFRPYLKAPKIVRGTRFTTFLSRYRQAAGSHYASFTTMPRPLTCYHFKY